ncbi:hypothetical protein SDC9_161235 [bioreactor metagenome]|uniref:Uncharacterized protein n=1 Tax=bioreactor metagenome TaxID=1076179 RepID=A0A645FKP2_9ZZZZ
MPSLYDKVNFGDMQGIAITTMCYWHIFVDLDDNCLCFIGRGPVMRNGRAKVKVTMLIHWAHLNHQDIDPVDIF